MLCCVFFYENLTINYILVIDSFILNMYIFNNKLSYIFNMINFAQISILFNPVYNVFILLLSSENLKYNIKNKEVL